MRLLYFSDVHGNQYAFRDLLIDIKEIQPDLVVFGGDIFGYYYGQKEILSILRNLNCICILGNHELLFLNLLNKEVDLDYLVGRYGSTYKECLSIIDDDDIQFLKGLKSRYDYIADGLHLVFVHGSIDDPLNGRIYPNTEINEFTYYKGIDYVFCGHTHHKLIKELDNGTIVINPGSIGQQRDGKGCTYVMFDTETKSVEFCEVQFKKDDLVKEICNHHEVPEMEKRLVEVLFRDRREST